MKTLALASAALAAVSALAAPTVSNVSTTQSNSQTVRVDYTLDEAAVVTLDILTNATAGAWASIGADNIKTLWGDVGVLVQPGTHTLYWAPEKDWIEAHPQTYDVQAAVKAWAVTAPPDYMVVDLRTDELRAGAPKIRYFETAEQVPDGVTDIKYKTDFLVMRKIPAKGRTYRMGSPSSENGRAAALTGDPNGVWNSDANWNQETCHHVTLTNDFYLGVYEYTRKQCITWSGYSSGISSSMSGGKEALPVGGDNDGGACNFADSCTLGVSHPVALQVPGEAAPCRAGDGGRRPFPGRSTGGARPAWPLASRTSGRTSPGTPSNIGSNSSPPRGRHCGSVRLWT